MKKNIMIITVCYAGVLFSSQAPKHDPYQSTVRSQYELLKKRTDREIENKKNELEGLESRRSYYKHRIKAITPKERGVASVKKQAPVSKL